MTKRDFFTIIIKLFSMFTLLSFLVMQVPSNISFSLSGTRLEYIVFMWVAAIGAIVFSVLVFYNASKIVSTLKLDHGFDDDRIDLGNGDYTGLMKIALVVIGGLLLVNNFTDFMVSCISRFRDVVASDGLNISDNYHLVTHGLNVVVGYLIITNANRIALWLKDKIQY